MTMTDFHTKFEVEEAIEDALKMKEAHMAEVEKINNYIFFLKYYLATGIALETDVIDFPGEDDE